MKPLLKIALGLFCLAAFATNASASVFLTTFGNTSSPTFVVDSSTSFSRTQTGSSIQISGLDNGSLLAGTFNPISILGNSSVLTLTGSATSAPAIPFTITLFDSNFNTALYQGAYWTGLSTVGTTSANFVSAQGGFNFADVSGFQLDTGGLGNNVAATLTGLTAGVIAVPEPSRALLGMLGLGLVALRRRRR